MNRFASFIEDPFIGSEAQPRWRRDRAGEQGTQTCNHIRHGLGLFRIAGTDFAPDDLAGRIIIFDESCSFAIALDHRIGFVVVDREWPDLR